MRRSVALAWAVAAAAVLLVLTVAWARVGEDLHVYLAAGRDVLHGGSGYVPFFDYPPGFLPFAAGLAELGPTPAAHVLLVLDLAVVAFVAGASVRLAGWRFDGPALPVTVGLTMLSLPVFDAMGEGNVSVLVGAAGVAVVALLERRPVAAGALLGTTLAVKPMLAPLVLLFVYRRQWRGLLTAVATALVTCGVVVAVTGRPAAYVHHGLPFLFSSDRSLTTSLAPGELWLRITLAAAVLLAAWVCRRDPLAAASLLMVAVFVGARATWPHYLFVLTPAVVLLVCRAPRLGWPIVLAAVAATFLPVAARMPVMLSAELTLTVGLALRQLNSTVSMAIWPELPVKVSTGDVT